MCITCDVQGTQRFNDPFLYMIYTLITVSMTPKSALYSIKMSFNLTKTALFDICTLLLFFFFFKCNTKLDTHTSMNYVYIIYAHLYLLQIASNNSWFCKRDIRLSCQYSERKHSRYRSISKDA